MNLSHHQKRYDIFQLKIVTYPHPITDMPKCVRHCIPWPSAWQYVKRQCWFGKHWPFMHISKHRTYMFLILQKLSRTLRSLGFGLSRETFANFLRVSVLVSENLVSKKKSRFWFQRIRSRKKVSVSVSKNLVSDKKCHFQFRKKKPRYRFRSRFCYSHLVTPECSFLDHIS